LTLFKNLLLVACFIFDILPSIKIHHFSSLKQLALILCIFRRWNAKVAFNGNLKSHIWVILALFLAENRFRKALVSLLWKEYTT